MHAINLPELESDLREWLSRRAASHGLSLEEEVRAILRETQAREEAPAWEAALADPMPLPSGCPPSVEIIRQMRDER